MENENFSAAKANEPLMSQNIQAQNEKPKQVTVTVVEEEKIFIPKGDGDNVQYKKEFGQVEIKQQPKFIGLTQEELKQYADDPFWRRLRLVLFALFWLAWILMFVVAIVLVVLSPKCPEKPQRAWWQKQLCYQIYTRSFKDSDGNGIGDFKGIKEKIPDLARLQVSSIWPVPVLNSTSFTGYDVANFVDVDDRLGTLAEFEDMVSTAHSNGMDVIIDLPLATASESNEWFQQSTTRSSGNYSDHFIWYTDPPRKAPDTKIEWVPNSRRGQNYMAYVVGDVKYPVLNWASISLRQDMRSVVRTWLDRGVDGFHLGFVQLLGVQHDGTIDWVAVKDHLKDIRKAIEKFRNDTGSAKNVSLFASLASTDKEAINELELEGREGLDYIINKDLVSIRDGSCDDAKCIRQRLLAASSFYHSRNHTWPAWEIGSPYESRITTRFGGNRTRAELMQMLLFMLEGAINVYYGDELGLSDINFSPTPQAFPNANKFVMRSPMQWDGSKHAGFSTAENIQIPVNPDYATNNFKELYDRQHSSVKLFKKMAEWRKNDEAFLYERTDVLESTHSTVLGIRRNQHSQGAPTYLAIMNFASVPTTVNLEEHFSLNKTLPDEVTVAAMTSNLAMEKKYNNRDTIKKDQFIELEAYSGMVVKYKE